MAKPKDVSQLSDAQRKQLRREGYVMADGTRYALDQRTGKFFVHEKPQWRWRKDYQTGDPHHTAQEKGPQDLRSRPLGGYYQRGRGPDAGQQRVRITPEDQNRYQEHVTPDEFLGLLDLHEKRRKRGYN